MATIGSYEAKTHLPRLLAEVEAGASFTITKHGRPVARLVGVRGAAPEDVVAALHEARAGLRLDMPVGEAKAVGRR